MLGKKPSRPLIIAAAISSSVLLFHWVGLLDTLELKTLDLRFRVRGQLRPSASIVLISIDQDSFDEIDSAWPWPRSVHAELIRKVSGAGPKLIGVDVLLPGTSRTTPEDIELSEAIREAGNVVLAAEYTEVMTPLGKKTTMNLPAKPLRDVALGYGVVNLYTDRDGVVRRAPLQMLYQDRLYRGYAHEVYRHLEGAPAKIAEANTPVLINFRGPAGTYQTVPYYRILRGEIPLDGFRDKIVLVGAYAPSLHDVFPTPFSPEFPTAGVEIQANLLESLLLDEVPSIFSPWKHFVLFVGLSMTAIFLSLRPGPYSALLLTAGFVAAACALNFYVFARHHLLVPLAPSFLAMAGIYGSITVDGYIREYRERLRLRARFGQYVSAEVVDEIMEHQDKLALRGKRRHITVLFSDIRDFTKISEQNDPETVVALLSDYLGQVTQIVFENGGTVDKFIGDAVMVIFGAPKTYGNDAERAVKTAAEMLLLVQKLDMKWREAIGRPLRIGIGINTGEAVVGSIGSEIRSDYTAIGDSVNTASRLEGLTKEIGVPLLFSEHTAAELHGRFAVKPLGRVQVIGRETPLGIFTTEEIAKSAPGETYESSEVRKQQHK